MPAASVNLLPFVLGAYPEYITAATEHTLQREIEIFASIFQLLCEQSTLSCHRRYYITPGPSNKTNLHFVSTTPLTCVIICFTLQWMYAALVPSPSKELLA